MSQSRVINPDRRLTVALKQIQINEELALKEKWNELKRLCLKETSLPYINVVGSSTVGGSGPGSHSGSDAHFLGSQRKGGTYV
jgi:hypothetical protein